MLFRRRHKLLDPTLRLHELRSDVKKSELSSKWPPDWLWILKTVRCV